VVMNEAPWNYALALARRIASDSGWKELEELAHNGHPERNRFSLYCLAQCYLSDGDVRRREKAKECYENLMNIDQTRRKYWEWQLEQITTE